MRREVFNNSNDKAIAPASVLFYSYTGSINNDENIIEHITLKPSRFFSLFKVFSILRNDYKKITQKQLKQNDHLWKILVYGNYLDFNFIKRLNQDNSSIGQEILDGNLLIKQGLKRKDGDKSIPVNSLLGFDFLDTRKKELKPFLILESKSKWTISEVGYIYQKDGVPHTELFEPYSLLITGGISSRDYRSNAAINHKKRVFTSSIRAIKINQDIQLDILYNMNGIICSSLFSYYMLMLRILLVSKGKNLKMKRS